MSFVRHVKALEPGGSAVAVLAMITRCGYQDVRERVTTVDYVSSPFGFDQYLAEQGYAVLRHWVAGPEAPPLWAESHAVKVRDRGHNERHVLALQTGDVLDPESSVIRKLTDYPFIYHVTSVHKVCP